MVFRTHLRALAALAAFVLMATVHGEGARREATQDELQRTRAALKRALANQKPLLKAFAGGEDADTEPVEVVVPSLPNLCPHGDPAWRDWFKQTVPFLLQFEPPENDGDDPYLKPADVSARASQIMSALALCKAQHEEPSAGMLSNLRKFIESRANADPNLPNPQHMLGHGISDDDFLRRAAPALEIPCLLRSQRFLKAMSSPTTYVEALQLIDDQNKHKPIGECAVDPSASGDPQWVTLTYRSRFLTTPDHAATLGRLLVVVPAPPGQPASGAAYDRWVQFGMWTPDDRPRGYPVPLSIHNVSIVAIAKSPTPVPTATAAPVFDAMADWFRCQGDNCKPERLSTASMLVGNAGQPPLKAVGPADPSLPIELRFRLGVTGDGDDCQACHKMVPLSIHPSAVYHYDLSQPNQPPTTDLKAEDDATVRLINRMIFDKYQRPPVWQTGSDDLLGNPMDYGAYPFGDSPDHYGLPERTKDYVRACAQAPAPAPALTDAEIGEIRAGMNCADCHNGKRFGMLNYPQATEKRPVLKMRSMQNSPSNRNLIKAYITEGIMPYGHTLNLSTEGRRALYRCLSNEYLNPATMTGLFIDWLTQDGGAPAPSAAAAAMLSNDGRIAPSTLVAATTSPADTKVKAMGKPLAINGAAVFAERCSRCHSLRASENVDTMGPNLAGILKRAPAQTAWPYYSAGLRQIGKDHKPWTPDALMEFLQDQDAFIRKHAGPSSSGSKMDAIYRDPAVRRALVDYLATQH